MLFGMKSTSVGAELCVHLYTTDSGHNGPFSQWNLAYFSILKKQRWINCSYLYQLMPKPWKKWLALVKHNYYYWVPSFYLLFSEWPFIWPNGRALISTHSPLSQVVSYCSLVKTFTLVEEACDVFTGVLQKVIFNEELDPLQKHVYRRCLAFKKRLN